MVDFGITVQENQYRLADFDETRSSTHYYGYVNETGLWFIMREAISGNIREYRYARQFSNARGTYPAYWENRANLDYHYWDTMF